MDGGEARALHERGTDVIALGRAAILNPDWPRHLHEPGWEPLRPPVTRAQLAERAVSPVFATYLTRWRGFVVPEPGEAAIRPSQGSLSTRWSVRTTASGLPLIAESTESLLAGSKPKVENWKGLMIVSVQRPPLSERKRCVLRPV